MRNELVRHRQLCCADIAARRASGCAIRHQIPEVRVRIDRKQERLLHEQVLRRFAFFADPTRCANAHVCQQAHEQNAGQRSESTRSNADRARRRCDHLREVFQTLPAFVASATIVALLRRIDLHDLSVRERCCSEPVWCLPAAREGSLRLSPLHCFLLEAAMLAVFSSFCPREIEKRPIRTACLLALSHEQREQSVCALQRSISSFESCLRHWTQSLGT